MLPPRATRTGTISIHAPPRGATIKSISDFISFLFQFTPLREGRRSPWTGLQLVNISIHAPPRGATPQDKHHSETLLFQFTPLREGRLLSFSWPFSAFRISIHAPPRGATPGRSRLSSVGELKNFNSRPSARGDCYRHASGTRSQNFNSRPSARGDAIRRCYIYIYCYFNSRPSARGDFFPT